MKHILDDRYLHRTNILIAILCDSNGGSREASQFAKQLSRLGYKLHVVELSEGSQNLTDIDSSFYRHTKVNPTALHPNSFRTNFAHDLCSHNPISQDAGRSISMDHLPAVIVALGTKAAIALEEKINPKNHFSLSKGELLITFNIEANILSSQRQTPEQELLDARKSLRATNEQICHNRYFSANLVALIENVLFEDNAGCQEQTLSATTKSHKLVALHLPGFAAGQPFASAQALSQAGLISASATLSEAKNSKFGFQANIECKTPELVKQHRSPLKQAQRFLQFLDNNQWIHDSRVLHFHARSLIYSKNIGGDLCLADLLYFRLIGKDVYIHFRGSEARRRPVFDRLNPFSWFHALDQVDKSTSSYSELIKQVPYQFDTDEQVTFRNRAEQLAHGILVTDPEIQSYIPNSVIIPRIVDRSLFELPLSKDANSSDRDRLVRIAHAPSRPFIKGTQHIVEAVKSLRSEGFNVELDLIQGAKNSEVIERLSSSDIVIDQLIIGWYGVLSVEAMALGKPVICYIREDLEEEVGDDNPIINANPSTIYAVIRKILIDKSIMYKHSRLSREFAAKYHHPDSVAVILGKLYSMRSNYSSHRTYPILTHVTDHIFQFTEFVLGKSKLSQNINLSSQSVFLLALEAEKQGNLSLATLYYEFIRRRKDLPRYLNPAFIDSRISILMKNIRTPSS